MSVEGHIETLWDARSPVIQQVGSIADETGRTKVTVWKRSRQPVVREGEHVRLRMAAKNWYQERVSIAGTGRSRIVFPNRR